MIKMHENCGKPFFCPMANKIISPQIEWCIENVLVCVNISG